MNDTRAGEDFEPRDVGRAPAKIENSRERIVIIERQRLVRQCLAQCLGQELGRPVATFPDVASWRGRTCGTRACVIILSGLGKADEDDMIPKLAEAEDSTPVILLSDFEDKGRVTSTLTCGVRGYIPTDTPLEIVVKAIRLVLAGGFFVPANIILSGAAETPGGDPWRPDAEPVFTAREMQVIEALRQGKSNKSIADELRLSESTVKVHMHNVMKKLCASNRTEAVVKIGRLPAAGRN